VVVKVSLIGSSARVSLLVALVLFMVGVALVGMVVQVILGSSAKTGGMFDLSSQWTTNDVMYGHVINSEASDLLRVT